MAGQFNVGDVVVNLSLNIRDINVILGALGSLPYNDVHRIIVAIQSAGLQQMQEAEKNHAESLEWGKAVNEVKEDYPKEKEPCQTDQL